MVNKAKKSNVVTLDFSVVGLRYRMSAQEIAQLSDIVDEEYGVSCTLIGEPENEVDSMAVKVIGGDAKKRRYTGAHIGYIGRPANESLFELLQRGAKIKSCFLNEVDVESGSGSLAVELVRPPKKVL